jgi:hypothetical protein
MVGVWTPERWYPVSSPNSKGFDMTSLLPTTEIYDDFCATGGYTLEHYSAKWLNPFGLGEMQLSDTRCFGDKGFSISATPFRTGIDESIYDHLKYVAVSAKTFPVPAVGSIQFTSTITARTPGAEGGRVVHGRYTNSGDPYAESTLEGQQGGAVLNMIDFSTGQLFDWFVSGRTAFALVERLPSTITTNTTDPNSPEWVGPEKMYTQIVAEFPLVEGPQRVAIRFSRDHEGGRADWFLNHTHVASVEQVGIPLDQQGVPFTGVYPSLGRGEQIGSRIDGFVIGHGLFTMLDAFPFRHPDAPELDVSIPVDERRWGQGVAATFSEFRVETVPA